MSPLDASFRQLENALTPLHMGSLAIFEGPAPSPDEFRQLVRERLSVSQRHRQKVQRVPWDLARPVWVDDPHFSLDYHVRRTTVPAPGDDEQLRRLVTRVMSRQLDPTKPLWELWVVTGLQDGTWAQVNKAHHSMVDGLAAIDLTTLILDQEPGGSRPTPDRWLPTPAPSNPRLIAGAVASQAASASESLRWAAAAVTHPGRAAARIGTTAKGTASLAGLGRPAAPTTLTGPIGQHRRWTCSRASIEDVTTVRRAFGGTLNDVVLSVVTRGFRDLLISRGEAVDGVRLRAVVPVSFRRPGESAYSNRVGSMFAVLPVGAADPVQRLQAISAQLVHLKGSGQAVAGDDLMNLAGLLPPAIVALALRVAVKLPQHSIATVITNLPGPPEPLYALGRRMVRMYPYVPLGWQVRTGVAIISYLGVLHFGFTGDYGTTADLDVLRRGVELGLSELLEVAHRSVEPP